MRTLRAIPIRQLNSFQVIFDVARRMDRRNYLAETTCNPRSDGPLRRNNFFVVFYNILPSPCGCQFSPVQWFLCREFSQPSHHYIPTTTDPFAKKIEFLPQIMPIALKTVRAVYLIFSSLKIICFKDSGRFTGVSTHSFFSIFAINLGHFHRRLTLKIRDCQILFQNHFEDVNNLSGLRLPACSIIQYAKFYVLHYLV